MSQDTAEADGTLLVPVANPETADRQLDTAIDIAADRSSRILLAFVLEVPPQLSLADGRRYLLEDEHEELLADAVERVESRGIPADQQIQIARGVATGIVGIVEKHDVDTVLLGWRGRPPRQDVILGSHVDKILSDAPCDVLIERIKTPRPETVDSVLVPVAGGPHDAFAAEAAASIARRNDASVTLLSVLEPSESELSREEATALLAKRAVSFEGVRSVDRDLVEGTDIAGTITDWTTEHDVTVLGVSRGGLLRRALLGTISEGVGRHAAGTVVLAKRHDPVPSRLRRLLP